MTNNGNFPHTRRLMEAPCWVFLSRRGVLPGAALGSRLALGAGRVAVQAIRERPVIQKQKDQRQGYQHIGLASSPRIKQGRINKYRLSPGDSTYQT